MCPTELHCTPHRVPTVNGRLPVVPTRAKDLTVHMTSGGSAVASALLYFGYLPLREFVVCICTRPHYLVRNASLLHQTCTYVRFRSLQTVQRLRDDLGCASVYHSLLQESLPSFCPLRSILYESSLLHHSLHTTLILRCPEMSNLSH